ncbi:MAG: hypothetical protein ABEK04_02210 [Candidatus Nanohalobium sp.]
MKRHKKELDDRLMNCMAYIEGIGAEENLTRLAGLSPGTLPPTKVTSMTTQTKLKNVLTDSKSTKNQAGEVIN